MTESRHCAPGMFCWADLGTADQPAAKRFYGALFGWMYRDLSAGPGATYSMALVREKEVAAITALMPEQKKAGVPPHWNAYFATADVEASAKKAAALGGKVIMPPMEVMDAGRMALVQDPSGARFALWQPQKHPGAALFGEPGALCWAELSTRDLPRCRAFYTELFGWNATEAPMGGGKRYTVFALGEDQKTAGMMGMEEMPAEVPPHWGIYFAVTGCDAAAKKAGELGAKALVPPLDIPDVGRFAIFFDPQGAHFAILQPR